MLDRNLTGLPAIAALWIGFLSFVIAVVVTRLRRQRDEVERSATRSARSAWGIAVQVAAFFLVIVNGPRITLDPISAPALAEAGVVLALWLGATWLYVAATRAMGRNWSIVARTRADHELVQTGPFARLRHPIYTAIALQLVALAVAMGHLRMLVVALPLYAIGTWLRVAVEERMLRGMFGPAYDAYAGRVKRFVPGVF